MPRLSPPGKYLRQGTAWSVVLIALTTARPLGAAIIYSGLQGLAIPTNFDGIYLDIDTGVTSSAEFAGWDINPFFGGVGVANSPSLQPVRVGTGQESPILRLGIGEAISSSRLYSSDYGGSDAHLGSAPGQFGIGEAGYIGFSFTTNGGEGLYYGWLRVTFTANTGEAVIHDWAYEDSGESIVTGRVQQEVAVAGVKRTTVSPGAGESFTLGSPVGDPGGGNIGSLVKTGAGITNLSATQTYTGPTVVNGGTLRVSEAGILSATGEIALNTGGTLLLAGATGVNARLNPTALLQLNGGTLAVSGLIGLDQHFGTLTLSGNSTLDFGSATLGSTLRFAESASAVWSSGGVLSVWNWTAGVDHLFFGSDGAGLTTTQLNAIRFYSDNGTTLIGDAWSVQFVGSMGEISPVPEPSSVFAGVILCSLALCRERQRLRRELRAARLVSC